MRNEVLEDHLLYMAILSVHPGDRLECTDPLLRRLPDSDQDSRGEGDLELSGEADRLQPLGRVLGWTALVHDKVRVDRLQHQALGGGHLPDAHEVLATEHTQVRVRQHPPLESTLAGPDDV